MKLDTILNTDNIEGVNEFYDSIKSKSNRRLSNFTPICLPEFNSILSKGKFFNFTSQSGIEPGIVNRVIDSKTIEVVCLSVLADLRKNAEGKGSKEHQDWIYYLDDESLQYPKIFTLEENGNWVQRVQTHNKYIGSFTEQPECTGSFSLQPICYHNWSV